MRIVQSYLKQELWEKKGYTYQHDYLQLPLETQWQLELCKGVWASADQPSPSTALKVNEGIMQVYIS